MTDIYTISMYLIVTCMCSLGQNVIGVTLGGTLGHALCTGLAVIGGRIIAQKISVRTGNVSFSFVVVFAIQG